MNIKRYTTNKDVILKKRRVNGGIYMENTTRYCSIKDSLKDSLKEMNLIKNGKLPKKTWKEFCLENKKV